MSSVLKKVFKSVKKVFKKIVKVIKKVLKSKIFKIIVIAAAVFFTGGAALGALGATGAATAGTAATGLATTAAGVGTAASTAAAGALGAATVAAPAATGILGTLGSAVGTVSTWAGANPLLANTLLSAGGQMLSGAGAAKEAEEAEKKRERQQTRNNSTQLNIKEDTYGILDRTGYNYAGKKSATGVQSDAGGVSQYAQPTVMQNVAAKPQNVEGSKPKYFNASSNKWQQVGG